MADTRSLGTAVIGFATNISEFLRGTAKMEQALDDVRDSAQGAAEEVEGVGEAGKSAGQEAAEGTREYEEATREAERAAKEAAEAAKRRAAEMRAAFEEVARSVKNVGDTLADWGKKGLVAAGAVGGGLLGTVKAAGDFEEAFAQVRTLMEGASTKEVEDLRRGILDLSASMGEDLVATTKAAYQALSANVPQDNVLEFLKVAGKAAIAGVSDTETAVNVLTSVVNSYGSALNKYGDIAQQAQHESDVLFRTIVKGKIEFTDMGTSLGRVVSGAAAAGVSMEELGAAIATVTAKGSTPEQGITSVNQAITSLIKPTDDAAEAMDRLGIDYKGFQAGTVSFPKIMDQIAKSTKGSAVEINRMIPDIIGAKAVMQLTAEDGKLFVEFLNDISNSAGSTDAAFAIMARTLNYEMRQGWATFKAMLVEVGTVLMPEATKYFHMFTDQLKVFADWIKNNPKEFEAALWRGVDALKTFAMVSAGAFATGKIISWTGSLGLALIGIEKFARAFVFLTTGQATFLAGIAVWKGWGAAASSAVLGVIAANGPLIAALSVVAATVLLLITHYRGWKEVAETTAASQERLRKQVDATIATMKEKHQITQQEIDDIKKLGSAEEQHAALREKLNRESAAANADFSRQLEASLQKELGRAATREELLRAFVIGQSVERDVAKTTELFLRGVTDAELRDIERGVVANENAAKNKSATHAKYLKERGMASSQALVYLNTELVANNQAVSSEEELTLARDIAARYQISLLDATLGFRKNFNAAQYQLLSEGVAMEDAAARTTQAVQKQDTEAQAAELLRRSENLSQFHALNTQRFQDAARERVAIIEELQSIQQAAADNDGKLSAEQVVRQKVLFETLQLNMQDMTELRKSQREIEAAMNAQKEAEDKKAFGLAEEITYKQLDNNEKLNASYEILREKYSAYIDTVINSTAKSAEVVSQSSGESQEQIKNYIAALAESGLTVEEASRKWQQAYLMLPPNSAGNGNAVDEALAQYGTISNAVQNLASTTQQSTENMATYWRNYASQQEEIARRLYDAMQYADPTVRHSPSLVENTVSGLSNMTQTWEKFSGKYAGIMRNVYAAMQYANPYARHSPSLVESVAAGAEDMTQFEQDALKIRWDNFKALYERQIAMLIKFWKMGGNLTYQTDTNAMGQITGGGIIQGPEGFDFMRDLLPLLIALKQMGFGDDPISTLRRVLRNEYDANAASPRAIRAPSTEPVAVPVIITPVAAASSPVLPTPWRSDGKRMYDSTLGGAGVTVGAGALAPLLAKLFSTSPLGSVGEANSDAQASFLMRLMRGQIAPDNIGTFHAQASSVGGGPNIVINIPISNVRSDSDIAAIAERMYNKIQTMNWRLQR